MNRLASMLPEYEVVMNMYGAGESTYPQLMAEIGDVTRFERKQSLSRLRALIRFPKIQVTNNPEAINLSNAARLI